MFRRNLAAERITVAFKDAAIGVSGRRHALRHRRQFEAARFPLQINKNAPNLAVY